jgi:tetratricopeptide (TPR) repeat protein
VTKPSRRWRVNWRAALILTAAGLITVASLFLVRHYQGRRIRRAAIEQARRYQAAGKADLAIRSLNSHLGSWPNDWEAMDFQAQLMGEGAQNLGQLLQAAQFHERLIRQDPEGPGREQTRRRLADLDIRFSDAHQQTPAFQAAPELAAPQLRYQEAAAIVQQLIDRGAQDPGVHRLKAEALEGLAVPGNRQALDQVVAEYRLTLQGDPRDLEAAERLARIYRDRLDQPADADRVLNSLLQARPDSAQARLIRYQHFAAQRGREEQAEAELKEASKLAPADVSIRLTAAGAALQRGDTRGAQRHLEAISAPARDELRVRVMQGMVEFGAEHPDEGIACWRQGLLATGGTDLDLTWRLAYALLKLGRVSEAKPLLAQYSRLLGVDDAQPQSQFLEAVLDEKSGRLDNAIRLLEKARDRIDQSLRMQLHLELGRCYEARSDRAEAQANAGSPQEQRQALRERARSDRAQALAEYRQATTLGPTLTVSRLAVSDLLLKHRAEDSPAERTRNEQEAIAELERGLAMAPQETSLLVALCRIQLRQQTQLPAASRSWRVFDQTWQRAIAVAPAEASLVLMQAARLSLEGTSDKAITLLESAAGRSPRSQPIWLAWARALDQNGRTEQALQVLERASAATAAGDSAALRIGRAQLLTKLNRGSEAHALLVRGDERLALSDRALVWETLGRLELAQGDVAGAQRAYAQWARVAPDASGPLLAQLDLALSTADERTAHATIAALKDLVGADDNDYRLGRVLELLYDEARAGAPAEAPNPRLEEAVRLVEKVLEQDAELPLGHLMQGRILERKGKPSEAIAAYRRAWERGAVSALPRLIDLLTRQHRLDDLEKIRQTGAAPQIDQLSALAFLRSGDRKLAQSFVDHFVQGTGQAPTGSSGARLWQAEMLARLGDPSKAEASLKVLAEANPQDPEPWLRLLRLQVSRNETAAVAATLKRIAAELKTDYPELLQVQCRWVVGDRGGALKALKEALGRWPDDVRVQMSAARFYDEMGRAVESEACLRHILQRDPSHRPAVRLLSTILAGKSNDLASWERAWATLGPESPGISDPEERLARAFVLSRCPDAGRKGQAIELLEKLVADLAPGHQIAAPARDALARLLLESGRVERAIEIAAVSAASGADPTGITFYATALLQGKRLPEAGRQLDLLAWLSPGDEREAKLRADLVRAKSTPSEAAAALEKAYLERGDGAGAEALGRAAFALLTTMGPEAKPVTERVARRLAQRNPGASWILGWLSVERRQYDEAMSLCQKAAPVANLRDLIETGRLALHVATQEDPRAPRLAQAEAILQTALQREPASTNLLAMLAMLNHSQERYDAAVKNYRAALALDPGNPLFLNNLAWALSEGLHKPSEALELTDELMRLTGDDVKYFDTRGMVLLRLGRLEEALRVLEKGAQSDPTGIFHYHLALAYQKANRPEDSKKALELALKAGLTPAKVEPGERPELEALLKR